MFTENRTICFSLYLFSADSFDVELVHGICKGKAGCNVWILVKSKSGIQLCGQEGLLMYGYQWMVDTVYENLLMFDI